MFSKIDPDLPAGGPAHTDTRTAGVIDVAESEPHPGRSWSLAARLTAWYAASAFALILLAMSLQYWALSRSLGKGYDLFLTDKIRLVSELLHDPDTSESELRQEITEGLASRQYAHVEVRILDDAGRIVMQSPRMSQTLPADRFDKPVNFDRHGALAGKTIVATDDVTYRAMSVHVKQPSGENRVIQVALSKSPEDKLLAGFRRALALLLIVSLGVCTLVGYEIARHGIRPIHTISQAAREIRSTTLHQRIAQTALPSELSDLAASFNNMLDRLEGAFGRLNRFSADIAHELRTPVNNLRGQTEVALSRERSSEEYREILDSCLEESVRLSRIIDSLLFLARAENPRAQLQTESVNLLQQLQSVYDFFEAAVQEAGVELAVAAPPDLSMNANHTLLQRAIANLVNNALRHTPGGGRITLSAQVLDGGQIRIEVADTGVGISPEDLPHVMDRFYRADRSRSSVGSQPGGHVGLGLAIVASIAAMHGGRIDIQSELGKGTRVMLDFSAAS